MTEDVPLKNKKGYLLQLINFGRLMENPRLLKDLPSEDWIDPELQEIVAFLEGDSTTEEKDNALENFLSQLVNVVWRITNGKRLPALTDKQRRNALCDRLAVSALEAHEMLSKCTATYAEMENAVNGLSEMVRKSREYRTDG